MQKKIQKNITKYVKKNDLLVVAVSGGPDSIALLHLLKQVHDKLIVVHLNHPLRGKESDQDQKLVEKLAKKLKLPFEIKKINVKKYAQEEKLGLEEAARVLRYQFLREIKEKHQAKFIVTAHHLDDQIETIFLNIIRGAGLKGASGIEKMSGDLLRPLLLFTKEDLLNYCKDKKLSFCLDKSNQDLDYSRNLIRHHILPPLRKLNPNLHHTIDGNRRIFREAQEFISKKALEYIGEQKKGKYSLETFRKLHSTLQKEALRQIYFQEHGNTTDLTQNHLDQVLKILRQKVSGKQKEFGPGKIIQAEHHYFLVKNDRH